MKTHYVGVSLAILIDLKGLNLYCKQNYFEYLEDESFENPRSGDTVILKNKGEIRLSEYRPEVKCRYYPAPSLEELQCCLRETYGIEIFSRSRKKENTKIGFYYDGDITTDLTYKTYEEALDAGLEEAVKLITT